MMSFSPLIMEGYHDTTLAAATDHMMRIVVTVTAFTSTVLHRTGERKAFQKKAFARGNMQLAAHFKLYQHKVD